MKGALLFGVCLAMFVTGWMIEGQDQRLKKMEAYPVAVPVPPLTLNSWANIPQA